MIRSIYSIINCTNLAVIEAALPVPYVKGYCYDNLIILSKDIKTAAEFNCVLAEEVGHQLLTYGNILNYQDTKSIKQEIIARRWAYEQLIPLNKIIESYKYGCRNHYEAADFLNVTEDFLTETVDYYKVKYGLYHKVDEYTLCFDPLTVLKLL